MDFWKRWNNESAAESGGIRRDLGRCQSWILGVALGVCFLALGAWNDQFADIYRKAIMICLECIGIG